MGTSRLRANYGIDAPNVIRTMGLLALALVGGRLVLQALRGNETVLDVGCGHGLMLLGAAKRLPRGVHHALDLSADARARRAPAGVTLLEAQVDLMNAQPASWARSVA